MSKTLDQIRDYMADYLNAQGVRAVTAWPTGDGDCRSEAVTAVSLRACTAEGSGLGDYLGNQYDGDSRVWRELYGKRLTVRLGLDLYAEGEGAAQRIQTAFDQLAGALHRGGPDGLKVKSFSCGETSYDKDSRLFRRQAEAECVACLYAAAEEGETFLDFEIRGAWNQ